MIERGDVYYKCALKETDIFALLIAAICHDFKHPGFTNSYLVNSNHEIAMMFNGKIIYKVYCIINMYIIINFILF